MTLTSSKYHSSFGSVMVNRNGNPADYRYSVNGQEHVDEVKGVGNHTTAQYWEYDPRLGRRWNLDPKPQIFISDYAVFRNNPIGFSDVLGDSSVWDNNGYVIYYKVEDKDLRVFMQDGDKLTQIGTLGGDIDASVWFPNLLKKNSQEADDIWNPLTFVSYEKEYGKWDYKNTSPANPNKKTKEHLLGTAFYRQDKENGLGDLSETNFLFDGKKGKAQDLNNFHFGVVGKAYGLFSEEFMLRSAGDAEMAKARGKNQQIPSSWRPKIQVAKSNYYGPMMGTCTVETVLGAPYGDNPIDHEWIKKGFRYYDAHRKDLDGDWW